MHHQQVGHGQAAAQLRQMEQGLLPVMQPRAVQRQHVPRPAGVLPLLIGRQPLPDALPGRVGQIGRVLRGDEMQRVQPHQMAHVPVLPVQRRKVVRPLRQGAVGQRPGHGQLRQRRTDAALMRVLRLMQGRVGCQVILQQCADHAHLKRASTRGIRLARPGHKGVLRGDGRAAAELPVPVLEQVRQEEFRRLPQRRQRPLPQEGLVPRAAVVGHVVQRKPGPAARAGRKAFIPVGLGIAPGVGHQLRRPAGQAVMPPGISPPMGDQPLLHPGKQRQMAVAEPCHLAQPVVHLGVDVQVHVTCPADAAGHVVVPHPLQGHGQRRVRPGPAHGQVPPEGKHGFRIRCRLPAGQPQLRSVHLR